MNWGWKLAIVYIAFVGVMISFVMRARNENVELVTNDYYEQELVFSEKMASISRANNLVVKPTVELIDDNIIIQYPENWSLGNVGTIRFYCPSDAKKDIQFPLEYNSGNPQIISARSINPGAYEVYFEWKVDGLSYFVQDKMTIE
ncbi:MAG: FixH family protein [Flavobacteriales bacterium]|nr:FixH family protein [Flavobacteriales bacterium]